MGFFFFLLFTSTLVFGIPCTEADLAVIPANSYTCDSLDISVAGLDRRGDANTNPLVITVTGDVNIHGNINLSGLDGVTAPLGSDTAANTVLTSGGNEGGGLVTGDGQPLPPAFNPEDGSSESTAAACESGGGGGASSDAAGQNGFVCTPAVPVGQGGAQFAFSLRGGGGGGAGVAHFLSGFDYDLGLGGSGGGALHIIAGGTITIDSGVTISARGGNGGNSVSSGGGGGGGGGGVIWLEGTLGITNNGTIDVRGGSGGINAAQGGTLGKGGSGGDGHYRLNNAGVVTDGTGITTGASSTQSATSLHSSIACGNIERNKNDNPFALMIAGFFLVMIFKTLFRFPKKFV